MALENPLYFDAILTWMNDSARRAMLETIKSEATKRHINEGRQDVLTRLLGLKFGELPEWAVQRLQAAEEADLVRWTERVLSAATLDDVFAGGVPVAPSHSMPWHLYTGFVGLCLKAGRVGALQHLVVKLFRLKFGELPEWALHRLHLGLEPDLERWTERLFTAASLDDVFAD